MNTPAPTIGDYGMIGDCRSAALISRDGALDWLCWPRFDSPAVFAGILDIERGGRWIIAPVGDFQSTRRYLPNTNVLEITFTTSTGAVTLTDFMPVADDAYAGQHLQPDHAIIRLLRCTQGEVAVSIYFEPKPDFGRQKVTIVDRGKLGLRVSSGHGMLALHSRLKFLIDGGAARTIAPLTQNEELPLVLTYAEASPEVMPILDDASASLTRTAEWWRTWAAACTYKSEHSEMILRSLLTLKLLEYPVSGAFIAAPTTSLPEQLGGKKNWDYRYCWLRDASFTIEVMCNTGYVAEAEAFAEWLMHATRLTQPKLMVAYDVYGNQIPKEEALAHLHGHGGSQPVNIGNGARTQSQLDTYGEVVAGVAMLLKHKNEPADRETAKVLLGFGQFVCDHWREPDAGIWEERGEPVIHTHSQLLSWTALDALIRLHDDGLIRKLPLETFKTVRDDIRRSIETASWIESESTYSSEQGRCKLDATLLRIAIHRFEDASSERMRATHDRVLRELGAGGHLLYRNLPDDGMADEGAFGICGFWRVECLAMGGGTLADAEAAFASLLTTANDLGLFSEETDPASNALLGNFPQAFTHLGMISAALSIERRRGAERSQA